MGVDVSVCFLPRLVLRDVPPSFSRRGVVTPYEVGGHPAPTRVLPLVSSSRSSVLVFSLRSWSTPLYLPGQHRIVTAVDRTSGLTQGKGERETKGTGATKHLTS